MGPKLRQLGLSVVAVLLLSLAVTPFASAAKFIASSYPANFSGVGEKGTWKFTTEAGSSECKSSSSAVLSEASSTLTLTSPSVSECVTNTNGFGSRPSTSVMEGCDSLIHITEGAGDSYTGTADLACPAGASILGYDNEKFCEVRIPAQAASVKLKFTNNTEKGWVESEITTSNITYNVIKDTSFCPYAGTGTKTGATLTQSSPSYLKLEKGTVHIG
jgi:hypothetical protein